MREVKFDRQINQETGNGVGIVCGVSGSRSRIREAAKITVVTGADFALFNPSQRQAACAICICNAMYQIVGVVCIAQIHTGWVINSAECSRPVRIAVAWTLHVIGVVETVNFIQSTVPSRVLTTPVLRAQSVQGLRIVITDINKRWIPSWIRCLLVGRHESTC